MTDSPTTEKVHFADATEAPPSPSPLQQAEDGKISSVPVESLKSNEKSPETTLLPASPLATQTFTRPPFLRGSSSFGTSSWVGDSSSGWSPSGARLTEDLFSGLTLVDIVVSIESQVDLLQRQWSRSPLREKIQQKSTQLKDKAASALKSKGRKNRESIDSSKEGFEKRSRRLREEEWREEVIKFKKKAMERMKVIHEKWHQAEIVSLRDKISFFFGVNNVFFTTFLVGFFPQWIPTYYTIQAVYFAPLRLYSYKKRDYHYFLFDLCYYTNVLCLLYLWVFPGSSILFQACYGLSLGPLATAVATWRNSLVFHSLDKVTSLFIHIYPPLVFTVIRHFYPNAEERFPALAKLPHLQIWRSLAVCSAIYLLWQFLYFRFVIVARREKIEKQGRVTSFTYLLNDKKGLIGKTLSWFKPENRETVFMFAQFIYNTITITPPILLFYESKFWSTIFIWAMFSVSVWNGASFYLEFLFRPLRKEITALRNEVEELHRQLNSPPTPSSSAVSRGTASNNGDGDTGSQGTTSPVMSPLIKGEGEGGGHGAGGEGGEEGDGTEFLLDGGRAFDDNGKATADADADADGDKTGNEGGGSNASERNGSSEGNSSDFELIKAGSSTSLSTAGEDPSAVSQGAAAVASSSIDQLTSGTTEGSH